MAESIGNHGGKRSGAGRPRIDRPPATKSERLIVWPLYKVCSCCNVEKRRDEFHKDKSRPRKIPSWCKSCALISSKKNYAENTEKCKLQMASWRIKNPERCEKLRSDWASKNKSHIAEYAKKRNESTSVRLRNKETYQRQVCLVSPGYAASLLNIHLNECPPELIQMKREQLLFKRELRKLQTVLKEQNAN
jgi:predicted nucleic acid binding AN1-type Zn finger protein